MRLLIIVFCFMSICFANAQTVFKLRCDFGFQPGYTKKGGLESLQSAGIEIIKPIRTDFMFITGLNLKLFKFNFDMNNKNSDFSTYYTNMTGSYFSSSMDDNYKYEFSYLSIPLGLEFKLTRKIRIHYLVDNNFYVGGMKEPDSHLEYGVKSLNTYMRTNTAGVAYNVEGVTVGLSSTFSGSFINTKNEYTYQFMGDLAELTSKAYSINLYFSVIFAQIKKRKFL